VTPPQPAPRTPRPIRDDAKVGQYQVVVSFRVEPHPDGWGPEEIKVALRRRLAPWPSPYNPTEDLDVAVREIGAGGEKSADEGRWDAPNRGSEHAP
jgi:hypothetical protein